MYDYCFLAVLLAVAVLVCLNWGPYETTTAKATESSKSNWLRLAKQQLCTCITLFLYISLPSLYNCDVK